MAPPKTNIGKWISALFIAFLISVSFFDKSAHADIFGEVGKGLDIVGDVLEDARDKARAEFRRQKQRTKKIIENAKRQAKKIEKKVRKLRDELKGEIAKQRVVGKVILDTAEAIELIIEQGVKETLHIEEKIENINNVIIEQRLDKLNLHLESSSNVLAKKIQKQLISEEKINQFLEKELQLNIRVIDILMPIQSIRERLDKTGTAKCVRKGLILRGVENSEMYFSGAANEAFNSLSDTANVERAVVEVVKSCVHQNFVKRDQNDDADDAIDEAQLTVLEKEKEKYKEDIRKSENDLKLHNEYLNNEKETLSKYKKVQDYTNQLALKAQEKKNEIAAYSEELDSILKEAGIIAGSAVVQ